MKVESFSPIQNILSIHKIQWVRMRRYSLLKQFQLILILLLSLPGEYIGNKRERNRRSDTSKRHILARQKQIDGTEIQNGTHNVTSSDNHK